VSGQETNDLILLADDSITILTMVSARLQRMGYDVVTATRGDEALALTLERRPRLVVLDLEMPGMSGFEVLQQIRADPAFAEMPIILLTSHTDESYVQAGREGGANAYVVKPFSPQELATRVDELLGRR
jgi:DNA-binding response OmpR family regulator